MTISCTISTLLIVLAGNPIDGLVVRDGGHRIGPVGWKATEINCGTNMTCTQSGNVATLSCSAAASDAGSTPQIALDAGYWLAHAVATLANGKDLGALGTGLVLNTSGTPSQYSGTSCTNQFPRSLNTSGVASCATVTLGTDTNTSIDYLQVGILDGGAGGLNTQVQYNHNGSLAGVSKETSDGTHVIWGEEATTPSAPSSGALFWGWVPDAGFPVIPATVDARTGQPFTVGQIGSYFYNFGASSNWQVQCWRLQHWNAANWVNNQYVSGSQAVTITSSGGGGTDSLAFDAGVWRTTQRWSGPITGANNESWAGARQANLYQVWRGNRAGNGGFLVFMRVDLVVQSNHARLFLGFQADPNTILSGLSGGVRQLPSGATDTFYLGKDTCDSPTNGDLYACSNDGTGSATCTDTGVPLNVDRADCADGLIASHSGVANPHSVYDIWFFSPGNAGPISWAVTDVGSGAHGQGQMTGDLPQADALMGWQLYASNGWDAGASSTKIYLSDLCIAGNW